MFNFLCHLKNRISLISNKQWLIGVCSILIAFLLVRNCVFTNSPSIATVDITGIVQQFVQSQAKLNLPANQMQQRVNIFGHQLEIILQDIAKTKHVILMPQEAVIAGSVDITPLVRHRLQELQNAKTSSNS